MCCNMAGSKNSNKCAWTSEEPKIFLDFIHKKYQNISPTLTLIQLFKLCVAQRTGQHTKTKLFPVCILFFYILLRAGCCSMLLTLPPTDKARVVLSAQPLDGNTPNHKLHFFSGFLLQIFKRFASH